MKTHEDGKVIHPVDLLWRIHDRFKLIGAIASACLDSKGFHSEEPMRPDVAEGVYQFGMDLDDFHQAVKEWFENERSAGAGRGGAQ